MMRHNRTIWSTESLSESNGIAKVRMWNWPKRFRMSHFSDDGIQLSVLWFGSCFISRYKSGQMAINGRKKKSKWNWDKIRLRNWNPFLWLSTWTRTKKGSDWVLGGKYSFRRIRWLQNVYFRHSNVEDLQKHYTNRSNWMFWAKCKSKTQYIAHNCHFRIPFWFVSDWKGALEPLEIAQWHYWIVDLSIALALIRRSPSLTFDRATDVGSDGGGHNPFPASSTEV